MTTLKLGLFGEDIARRYLIKQGYKILERNVRCKYGEIDIITLKNMKLIFFEVKTRRTERYGYPEEEVNYKILKNIKNQYIFF